MTKNITLHFKGRAKSKDNYKIISRYPSKKTGRYHYYLCKEYEDYEEELKRQAQSQLPKGWKPLEGNLWVSLFFYFKDHRHGDITNLPKSICDAMEDVVYKNDKQVWLDQVMPIYTKDKPEGFKMKVRSVLEI